MRRLIGAAVAAIALAFAGSASAAVLYTQSGVADPWMPLIGKTQWDPYIAAAGGEIELRIDFTTPNLRPMPYLKWMLLRRRESGQYEGTIYEAYMPIGTSYSRQDWDIASATENSVTLRLRNSGYACQDWTLGSYCSYDIMYDLYLQPYDAPLPTYTLTISSIEAGAVPEPATWAMMILGLGLAGAAIRRQSPNRAQLVPRRRDL